MSAPSLLDLPSEILLAIVESLCTHCAGGCGILELLSSNVLASQDAKISQAALCRLSISCKALRDIAQPVLYHCPISMRMNPSLARTLIQRPDLASLARELAITFDGLPHDYKRVISKEDQAFLEVRIDKSALNHHGQPAKTAAKWEARTVPNVEPDDDWIERENIIGMVMLAHTPNVQKMFLRIDELLPLIDYPQGTLSCLTTLCAQEGGEDGFALSSLAGIMKAAPNLKSFEGRMISTVDLDEGEIFSDSVTKVTLGETSISSQEFEMVIRGFPKLADFSFETGSDFDYDLWCVLPNKMGESLLISKDTLKKIHINALCTFSPDESFTRDEVMRTLKGMTSLETIILHSDCIYFGHEDSSYTDESHFIDFLPESVQVFGLVAPHHHLNSDILQLAASAPQKLPSLKKIMFQNLDAAQLIMFEPAFDKGGIEFVVNNNLGTLDTCLPLAW